MIDKFSPLLLLNWIEHILFKNAVASSSLANNVSSITQELGPL